MARVLVKPGPDGNAGGGECWNEKENAAETGGDMTHSTSK